MPVPVIQTERLILRPFVAEDAAALFAYAAAPEFSRYVEYDSPATLADAQAFLEQVLLPDDPDQLSWAICLHGQPDVIGTMQVTRDEHASATVHYDLSHLFYGQGFATEALRAALRYCLLYWPEVTLFQGDTAAANTGSRRVLEKCGFRLVKSEFENWQKSAEPVELVYYQVQRHELEALLS